jgi:putative membrane protein
VFPVLLAVPPLIVTRNRFRFTRLAYTLIAVHAVILMVGGKYTYAEVPAFNWLRDTFHMSRNHYDRVGHFAQGFVPALVAREVLLRTSPLRPGKWLFFLIVCVCLAISAAYELIEWLAAAISKEAAESFLGTQGDHWDTQKDMLLALVGAIVAQVTLARWQDRAMRESEL